MSDLCDMVIEDAIDRRLEGVSLREAADRHIVMLDMAPEVLNGVQFWRVGRQVADGDTGGGQGREDLLEEGTAMDRVGVQHTDTGALPPLGRGHLGGRSRQLGHVTPEERAEGGAIDLAAAAVVGQAGLRAVGGQGADDVDAPALRGHVGDKDARADPCPGARSWAGWAQSRSRPRSTGRARAPAPASSKTQRLQVGFGRVLKGGVFVHVAHGGLGPFPA